MLCKKPCKIEGFEHDAHDEFICKCMHVIVENMASSVVWQSTELNSTWKEVKHPKSFYSWD